jgi:uncharacterized protein YjbI with pentapeptide repeats
MELPLFRCYACLAYFKNISKQRNYQIMGVDTNSDTDTLILRNSVFQNSELQNSKLRNSKLQKSKLRNSKLRNSKLQNSELQNSELRHAVDNSENSGSGTAEFRTSNSGLQ